MAGQPLKRRNQAHLALLTGDELRQRVYDRIEAGVSLSDIAADLSIRRRWLCEWLEKPERIGEYARSRVRAATSLAEQTLSIADDVEENLSAVAKARLRIATRQWIARSWDRQTYGETNREVNVNLGLQHIAAIRKLSEQDDPPVTIEAGDAPGNAERPHHALTVTGSASPANEAADSSTATLR